MKVDGFYPDYRGLAELIKYPDASGLHDDPNPVERIMYWWTSHHQKVTLLDLQAIIFKLDINIYKAIAKAIGEIHLA